MRHRNRITKYKAKINTFRVSELQEFLAFVHLSNEGNKNVLRDRAWKSLKKELYLNENIDPELNKKIQELFE
ncbi:hypothetical protein CDAR_447511 [Caerostris darwini]|uniref:SAP domain-containing protein n=1 Tax=Caerostris darwini TaxID=1538125 RepID=A0AAV4PQ88_9ARAC|nr:hypothetical protein CDAR_447511 [Caerostris darwini]